MNLKTTLALIVVLAAIGVATYLLRGQGNGPGPSDDTPSAVDTRQAMLPEPMIDLDRLTRIELQLPQYTATLDRTDNGWVMTRPRRFPVNPSAIQELTAILTALKAEPRSTETPPGEIFGAVHLVSDNTTVSINLGPTLGGGLSHIMLEHEGKTQQLTADAALYNVITQMDGATLLARRLDTPSALRTERVDIQSAVGNVTLRKVDGRWYLGENGTGERALSSFLDGYTSVPGYLNIPAATDIIRYQPLTNDNPAAYGLDRPRVTLIYTRPGDSVAPLDTRAELCVGSPATPDRKAYYVSYRDSMQDEPVVVVLPSDFSAVLDQPAGVFRDPRVMESEPGLVENITIKAIGNYDSHAWPTYNIDLTQEPELEHQREAISDVQEWLKTLAAARAELYVDASSLNYREDIAAEIWIQSRFVDEPEHLLVFWAPTERERERNTPPSYVVILRENESIGIKLPSQFFSPVSSGDLLRGWNSY